MKLVQRANGAKGYLDVFGLITALPAGGDRGQLQYCGYSNDSSSLVVSFGELVFISWQTEVTALPPGRHPPLWRGLSFSRRSSSV